ncbi:unnamed protein product [Caenorhabditis sp. 36 PRJEB53466]|nr:unnamed protein product [Caenorhabditis sp. 36 PRJEB53466]
MDYAEMSSELSWLECFVDPTVVSKAINDLEKRKQLPRLCIQFTEKGFLAEKEKDKGKLAIEELMLFERKAASMRLCAMAIFAALDYDIDFIIDNISRNELLTLRVLADNFYKIYNEKNLDATFGNWLFYRFVLSIDRRNRLPPPAPSATVPTTFSNGQLMSNDPALVRHEKVQRMIMELREHVLKARAFITELAEDPRDVIAPGIQCFLKPFKELAPKAMTAALIGDRNVLIENPSADFDVEKSVLPAADVANKCLSELVVFLFTCGDLPEARKILHKVVKPTVSHPIVAIDEELFKAYSMALSVKGAFIPSNGSTVIKQFVFDQKVLADETSVWRKSEYFRYRGALETSGQLKQVYQAENAAMSVVECNPDCIRDKLESKAQMERFVKVLKKLLDGGVKWNKKKMRTIGAHMQYLCASIADIRGMLGSGGIDVTELRTYVVPSPNIDLTTAPTMEQLSNMVECNDPFWVLMTAFNLPKLKEALTELGPFWFPNTMPTSDFLQDILLTNVNTPRHTTQRLLLAKLEQLKRMRNYHGFLARLNEYFPEFVVGGHEDMHFRATYESIHVTAYILNLQCHLPFERKLIDETIAHQTSLIFKPEFHQTDSCAKMINQCFALMLNLGDGETVLDEGGKLNIEKFKCVPVARILGAYQSNFEDDGARKKCADGFWRTLSTKFIDVHRPSRVPTDAEASATAAREMHLLLHLLGLIREPRLLDFILACAVTLRNKLVLKYEREKEPVLIYAKLSDLYSELPAFSPKLEIEKCEDVLQLLRMMCENAYSVSRTDPYTIRTYADFLFSEKDFQGAGEKYMEYYTAISPFLRLNLSDPKFASDLPLQQLRICLAHSGYLTMSMLTCQLIKAFYQTDDIYPKAMELLRINETRDVGANCAEFITDVAAIELLSQHYHGNRMEKSVETLYAGGCTLAANKNVPNSLSMQETNRRTTKFLTSIASIYFGIHT